MLVSTRLRESVKNLGASFYFGQRCWRFLRKGSAPCHSCLVIRGMLEICLFIPPTDAEIPTVCRVLGKALEKQR